MTYELIRAHDPGETDKELRRRYVLYTDKLIQQIQSMTQGREEDGRSNVAVIYLDKSGRPVSWLVRRFWSLMAGDTPRPHTYFANIDREQWWDITGSAETGVDVTRLPDGVLDNLRATYAAPDGTTPFEERDLLVVDEIRTTGSTLMIASGMFEEAFPEARSVDSQHWMYRPKSSGYTSEVPVWYREETVLGRGVGNRDYARAKASPNPRQRAGYMFLSNRLEEPDRLSDQLRHEIDLLHGEVTALRQPVTTRRDDEELTPAFFDVLDHWYPDVFEDPRTCGPETHDRDTA